MKLGMKPGPKKGLPELGSRLKRPNKMTLPKIKNMNPGLGKIKL